MSAKYSFRLHKMYLDCIDHQGNCFIIYLAQLKLFIFNIGYSGIIFNDSNGYTKVSSWFKKIKLPEIKPNLSVVLDKGRFSGIWQQKGSSLSERILYSKNNKYVSWHCHHPATDTSIIYKGQEYKGWGYGEVLSLTLEPWNLPISELRWGRFLSETQNAIWIQWKGKYPVNLMYLNGKEYHDARHLENKIVFNNDHSQIIFNQRSIIRKGRISGLFAKAPWIKVLLPLKILKVTEQKFKSHTSFWDNGVLVAQGWSLFEVVEW